MLGMISFKNDRVAIANHRRWLQQVIITTGTFELFQYSDRGGAVTPNAQVLIDDEIRAIKEKERLPGKEATLGKTMSSDAIVDTLKNALASGAWDLRMGVDVFNSNVQSIASNKGAVVGMFELPLTSKNIVLEAQINILDKSLRRVCYLSTQEEYNA